MALNKTPSSHSGFFSELTASAGKQSNFLVPVRIKMTPNTSIKPLSDNKENSSKMLKPVLIKDLFPSLHKDRYNSTTFTSVSTQKKKARSQRLNQPYLNTQSCYKLKKNEVEETTLFDIKSSGGSKVRRQLYQTLDSPQKFSFESKENTNKNVKTEKLSSKNLDETVCKNDETNNKIRKSYLLPPNTIKNSFLGKPESNLKTLVKQTIKGKPSNTNKNTKGRLQQNEKKKQNFKSKQNTEVNSLKGCNTSFHSTDNTRQALVMKDTQSMTSPAFNSKTPKSKLFSMLEIGRPTVIISPSNKKSCKPFNNSDNLRSEMQNLSVSPTPYNCTQKIPNLNTTQQVFEFNFKKMSKKDQNGLMQLKPFLEQSLQTCKSQVLQLKQSLQICENQALQLEKAIECIDKMFIKESEIEKTAMEIDVNSVFDNYIVENSEITEKCNLSYTILDSKENSSTGVNNKSLNVDDNKNTEKINNDNVNSIENKSIKSAEVKSEKKLPIPIKVLVEDADLNQDSNEASLDALVTSEYLSTIGEVSCELSSEMELKKDGKDYPPKENQFIIYESDSENKENIKDSVSIIMQTPRTPKTRSQSIENDGICNSQRRRSARLAAKCMSHSMLSDSEKQDSFTLLENELNVVHNPPSSKSLPASPIKISMTPLALKQWDKRIERPLKEYMALKMNGTFLVTPDVKRFQSCLEPNDTPHSRKSLSRKIFLELCDLYAESPEHS